MKATKLILGIISVLAICSVFTSGLATGGEGYVVKESEEHYGTWVNLCLLHYVEIFGISNRWAFVEEELGNERNERVDNRKMFFGTGIGGTSA